MKKEAQLFKVRMSGHNEQIIHAPAEASGWFRLEVDEKGNLHYWKVNA